jgi:hypothetical protein
MDYERAYTYLADRESKPTYETFLQSFLVNKTEASNYSLQIGQVHLTAGNGAWVEVSVIYSSSGLFDSGWTTNDKAALILQNDGWKITYLPYPYWGWDWYTPTPMPLPAPGKP